MSMCKPCRGGIRQVLPRWRSSPNGMVAETQHVVLLCPSVYGLERARRMQPLSPQSACKELHSCVYPGGEATQEACGKDQPKSHGSSANCDMDRKIVIVLCAACSSS